MSGYKKEQIQTYTEILLGSFRRKKLKVEEQKIMNLRVRKVLSFKYFGTLLSFSYILATRRRESRLTR